MNPIKISAYAASIDWDLSYQDAYDAVGDYNNHYFFEVETKYVYPNPGSEEYSHSSYTVGGIDHEPLEKFFQDCFALEDPDFSEQLVYVTEEPTRRVEVSIRFKML